MGVGLWEGETVADVRAARSLLLLRAAPSKVPRAPAEQATNRIPIICNPVIAGKALEATAIEGILIAGRLATGRPAKERSHASSGRKGETALDASGPLPPRLPGRRAWRRGAHHVAITPSRCRRPNRHVRCLGPIQLRGESGSMRGGGMGYLPVAGVGRALRGLRGASRSSLH